MKHSSKAIWEGGMNFSATFDSNNPHELPISDANGNGYSPKRLLLSGLIGCTGLDVAGMLKKMRAEPEKFELEVEANLTEEHPKYYDKVHIIYRFAGNIQKDKIERAVELSVTKYCGVSAMFEKFATLTHEIVYEE